MIAMLANHLWQSTLFVAVIGVLALALRNNGASLRYWLWMAASVKFILPFSLLVSFGAQLGAQIEWRPRSLERPSFGVTQDWTEFANAVVQPATNFAVAAPAPERIHATPMWSIDAIVLLVWGVGFVTVLLYWIYRWTNLQNVLSKATAPNSTIAGSSSFPVPIKCAPGLIEPGIVGILRPVLLVPEGLFEKLSRQQIGAILAHERCHLERRDNLTAGIHMFVEAVFWFHPVIWWIGARLIEERERACDAAVLKEGNDPETYASGILDVCQHYVAAPLDCVAGVSGAELKKRVRAIMTFRGEARVHLMKWMLLASVSLIVVASPVLLGALTITRAEAIEAPTLSDETSWPKITTLSIAVGEEPTNGMGKSLLTGPNGTFTTRNWSLRGIIAYAYGIQDSEIQELTAGVTDMASTRYNIIVTSKEVSAGSRDVEPSALDIQRQFKLLVRRVLAEQFQLQFHWESRWAPVYVMTVSDPNLGLKVAKAEDPGPSQGRGANSVSGYNTPLILLKQFLSNQLRRPIVDQTGLTGRYNYRIKWGPEPGDAGVGSSHESMAAIGNPTAEVLIESMRNQLGLALTSRDGEVQRMVVDRLEQPSILKPKPVEVAVAVEILDRYVGYYDFPQSQILTITRTGDKLFALLMGQPPLPIFATSERDFFAKAVDVTAAFAVDEQGRIEGVLVNQNGRAAQARRLDDSVGKARLESVKARIRDKIAQPETEAALRRHLDGMFTDQPAYDLMAKEVADSVRAQWPAAKARYVQLGRLRSIEFKQVDQSGTDNYLAVFENGSTEWRVGLDADGKIDRLNYRRLNPP